MEERSSPMIDSEDSTGSAAALRHLLRPELFKALGDATRVEVLMRLITAPSPQTVSDIADCCGVHLSGVSRHLSALRNAGIVIANRQGREVRYEIDCGAITGALRGLADAIDSCRSVCCAPGPDGDIACPTFPPKKET